MTLSFDHFDFAKVPLGPNDLDYGLFEHNVEGDDVLWHYTDTGGFIGIIEHDALWATSTTALNDPSELRYGLGILDEAKAMLFRTNNGLQLTEPVRESLNVLLEEHKERLITTGMYVLCASTARDSLSNWRAYADLGGYAVGLSRPQLLGVLTPQSEVPIYDAVNRRLGWWKVFYDRDSQIAACGWLLRAILLMKVGHQVQDHLRADFVREIFTTTIACMKHPTFSDEREVRLFVSGHDFPPSSRALQYRKGKYGVTPYLLLTGIQEGSPAMNSRNGHIVQSVPRPYRLPIDQVMIGPATQTGAKKFGVESLLATYGYEGADVDFSMSPAND